MTSATSLSIRGETLVLHPDRAVIWPRGDAVIVADTHFGKSSVFGRHGIAVPGGSDELDRARLASLLAATGMHRLMILGDFVHEPMDEGSQEARDIDAWTRSLVGVKIQVIAGNHDRGASSGWRGPIDWLDGECHEPPFRFVHDCSKPASLDDDAFSLSGHVHPVVALRGLRKRVARVPAFWLRKQGLILPSFGLFTGGYLIAPVEGEQVFAVGPDRVVPFPKSYPTRGRRS